MSKQQVEIELLVLAAQGGNEDAFRVLFTRLNKSLLSFALKVCGQEELAADAAQEAWIEVARDIRKLDDPRAFRSWLYRKVRWRMGDLLRKQGRLLTSEFEESEHEYPATDNAPVSLGELITKLPPLEQEMMHLFYLQDFSVKEIAQILTIAEGTVKSRLNRARNMLKEKFE